MPLLLVKQDGVVRAGQITGRVVIGRWASGQIVTSDQAVSRIHAWIGQREDGGYFVADAGSRTGTFVNKQRVPVRANLKTGDVIRAGRIEIQLIDDDQRPPAVEEIDLGPQPVEPPSPGTGIMIDCACGAPIWAPWYFAGRSGLCRHCGQTVSVPLPPGAPNPATQPAPQSATALCGVCHAPVQPNEESSRCPDCHTTFHIECWTDNLGCSTYGCAKVSSLKTSAEPTSDPTTPPPASAETLPAPDHSQPPSHTDPILLAGSVVSVVAGALSFGIPAAAVGLLCILRLTRGRPQHRKLVMLAATFAILGAVAGVATSYIWWIGPAHGR